MNKDAMQSLRDKFNQRGMNYSQVVGEENTVVSMQLQEFNATLTDILQWRYEAVYGFHEYIMGKNIIQNETDQAFNYARLHKALDDYIAQLKESTPHEN